jgi:hypothetical protein
MRTRMEACSALGAVLAVVVAVLVLALVGIVPALADAAPARDRGAAGVDAPAAPDRGGSSLR